MTRRTVIGDRVRGRARIVIASGATALAAACTGVPETDPHMVSEWMHTLYGAIRVERLSPPVASRILAYATTALYAGITAADGGTPPLTLALNGLPALPRADDTHAHDATITAVTAERVVLDSLLAEALPTTHAALDRLADSLIAARVALGLHDSTVARSRDLGNRIGYAIVGWSRTDGFDSTRRRPWIPPVGEGLWVNDAPGAIYAAQNQSATTEFVALDNPANLLRAGRANDRSLILDRPKRQGLSALPPVNMAGMSEPHWARIRPFVLKSWDECPLPDPPAYSTDTASTFYREARTVYEVAKRLTDDQRTIALYWADNAGESGTPVGHWMSIASQLVSQRGLDARDAAALMLLTSTAQADAFIASWGYKYGVNLIRPRTYIRRVIDPAWEPFIPTPPFPEYPSGHSTQSAAAAAAITAMLGDMAFDDSTSITLGHRVRRFDSFGAAAREAGMSRVYGGLHFPSSNDAGRRLGECIGTHVAERLMPALP